MILEESQARERLLSKDNILNKLSELSSKDTGSCKVKEFKNGKVICHEGGGGSPVLGTIEKRIIAVTAMQGSPQETAQAFNISRQAATNLSNGKSTDGTKPDPEIRDYVESKKAKLGDLALDKAMEAFGIATSDKLEKSSARDAIAIAKDAVTVYEKLQPKTVAQTNVQVVVYRPPDRELKEYEVINVGEKL